MEFDGHLECMRCGEVITGIDHFARSEFPCLSGPCHWLRSARPDERPDAFRRPWLICPRCDHELFDHRIGPCIQRVPVSVGTD
jgi:hypothetical protein